MYAFTFSSVITSSYSNNVSTFVSKALAKGHNNVMSGYELSVSHLLTAGAEIPKANANCSCVIPFAFRNSAILPPIFNSIDVLLSSFTPAGNHSIRYIISSHNGDLVNSFLHFFNHQLYFHIRLLHRIF